MLTSKGKYYALDIIENINVINTVLVEQGILKPSHLGEPITIGPLSNIILAEFWANTTASIITEGFSLNIIRNFRAMGKNNLLHKDLEQCRQFYSELKKIHLDSSITMKDYEYFKLFYRYGYQVEKELRNALELAEKSKDIPGPEKGLSLMFNTKKEDDVVIMSNNKDNFQKNRKTFHVNMDFDIVGIKLKDSQKEGVDDKYIQINGDNIIFNKDSVIVNIPYDNKEELENKVYPVVNSYKNKILEVVGLISKEELIKILKDNYNASIDEKTVNNEVFYDALDIFTKQHANERPPYFMSGKKLNLIKNFEERRSYPSAILNVTNPKELNGTILSKRGARLLYNRKNKKKSEEKGKID